MESNMYFLFFGFKAFKIEESAKHIQGRVEELGRHIAVYEDYMKKLGNSLGTTVGHFNNASKELKKIDKEEKVNKEKTDKKSNWQINIFTF